MSMAEEWCSNSAWSGICRRPARRLDVSSGICSEGGRVSRKTQLEGEVQSLRECYSRQIAGTELRCEKVLIEKDEEMSRWYKEQKTEMKRFN